MSWKSGSIIASKIWAELEENKIIALCGEDNISRFATKLIEIFEEEDCVNITYECPEIMHYALQDYDYCIKYFQNIDIGLDEFIQLVDEFYLDSAYLLKMYRKAKNNE